MRLITIGNFDGVHIGHQSIISPGYSKKQMPFNGTSVAITFEPHPIRVLNHNQSHPPLITLYKQKN